MYKITSGSIDVIKAEIAHFKELNKVKLDLAKSELKNIKKTLSDKRKELKEELDKVVKISDSAEKLNRDYKKKFFTPLKEQIEQRESYIKNYVLPKYDKIPILFNIEGRELLVDIILLERIKRLIKGYNVEVIIGNIYNDTKNIYNENGDKLIIKYNSPLGCGTFELFPLNDEYRIFKNIPKASPKYSIKNFKMVLIA